MQLGLQLAVEQQQQQRLGERPKLGSAARHAAAAPAFTPHIRRQHKPSGQGLGGAVVQRRGKGKDEFSVSKGCVMAHPGSSVSALLRRRARPAEAAWGAIAHAVNGISLLPLLFPTASGLTGPGCRLATLAAHLSRSVQGPDIIYGI